MYNSRKRKKILILLLITLTVSFFELSEFDWVKDNLIITPESYTDPQPIDVLRTADYTSSFDGNGEDMDIALHQSIYNGTDISFLDLDNRNSFKEPSPTVNGFNSSYVNFINYY